MSAEELSEHERAILDFEASHRGHTGRKEEDIRRELNIPPARYYMLLGRLIDTLPAIEYAPQLCSTLRRIRDAARADHDRRTKGTHPS